MITVAAVVRRCRCTAIVAEAPSFGGPPKARFAMADLARALARRPGRHRRGAGIAISMVPPNRWQHAVLGRETSDRSAVDYDEVFRRLSEFIGREGLHWDRTCAELSKLRISRGLRAEAVATAAASAPSGAEELAAVRVTSRDDNGKSWRAGVEGSAMAVRVLRIRTFSTRRQRHRWTRADVTGQSL